MKRPGGASSVRLGLRSLARALHPPPQKIALMASLRQLPRGMGVNSGTVTLGHGLASGTLSSQISVHLQLAATASPYGTRWREGKVVPQRALRGKGPGVVWKPSCHSDKELGENMVNP